MENLHKINKMKKILIISLLFIGCSDENFKANLNAKAKSEKVTTVIKDGCEYIAFYTYGGNVGFTHKGNCKNPIHYFKTGNNLYKYNIVLPEEYPLMSTNPNKPDTFTAYASRDTIYFQFDNFRNK